MCANRSRQRCRTKNPGRPVAVALLLLALGGLPVAGCSCTDTEIQEKLPSLATELPEVHETPDEIRTEMILHERLSAEFKQLQLKLMVANHKIVEREGVEGHRQVPVPKTSEINAYVDPQSGNIAWRAWTCYNPECSGRGKGGGPLIFVKKWNNARIGEERKVVYDLIQLTEDEEKEQRSKPPIICPSCGRVVFLAPYDSPAAELRRRQLNDELREVRAARDRARASDEPYPPSLRTHSEIRQEIQELPKLFLVPDQ
jgi:hypothetical protein